jgi:hypothetical protein
MGDPTRMDGGTHVPHLWDVSAADPGKLLDYTTVGLEMCDALSTRSAVVTGSLETLTLVADPHGLVPSMGDIAGRFADLAAGWVHLDDFVGDVGRGFARFLDPTWSGDRDDLRGGVVIAPDRVLAARGQIGFADRDAAIAAAGADFATLLDLLADPHVSAEEVEAIASAVRRGQHDPAYAVTLAELLGPDHYVDIVGVIEDADGDETTHPTPDPGWGLAMLAPFSTVLTTAADTRAGVPDGQRLDPGNAHLAADARLDRNWLTDFVDLGTSGGAHTAFHVSLLAAQATLPKDTVLQLVDARVTDMIRSEDGPTPVLSRDDLAVWGPTATTTEANLLRALGNNPDAAATWLDRADGDSVTNAEALLRYDIGAPYRNRFPDSAQMHIGAFGAAASDVWAAGLTVGDADLFDLVVDTVADEGELHLPGMEPGLATGTVAHMDDVHARINDRWDVTADHGTPAFEDTGVYLREVMRDGWAAEIMAGGTRDQLDQALATPDADGRSTYLTETGRTVGAITQSHANALLANGAEADEAAGDKADQFNFLVGLIPYGEGVAGTVNTAADALGPSAGDATFGQSAYDDAKPASQAVMLDLNKTLAIATATHHFDTGTINPAAAIESAQEHVSRFPVGEPFSVSRDSIERAFLDYGGDAHDTLPRFSEMSDHDQYVLLDWAVSPGGADVNHALQTPSVAGKDYIDLSGGAHLASTFLQYED